MKNTIINEGLDFQDMEGQVQPLITVDEYSAKMGKDSDIVTLSFKVNSEQAGQDLVDWFERGYNFILDASISDGEVEVGKYLVFVEMKRRSTVPEKILELLSDLKTLTKFKVTDWTVKVDDEDYDADEQILKQVIVCSPGEYKIDKENEEKLNEYRNIAGITTKPLYKDSDIKKIIRNITGI